MTLECSTAFEPVGCLDGGKHLNELDEAFLASVDRAMRVSKSLDPLRLDQVQRAVEHEIRMNRTGGF